MNYLLHLLIYLNIYVIVALSLNLVVGYCGLLTLAHAGYFAIGAYTYALTTLKLGLGFIPAGLLAVGVAAVLSLAVSLPSWRFKGDFFVMISLAVQTLVFSLLHNWFSPDTQPGTWANLTNGPYGLSGISKPAIGSTKFATVGSIAALSTMLALSAGLIIWLFVGSPWGRLLKAMRDDELAARGLGKNTRLAKVQAMAIACGFAALAGAIYSSYVSYIDPSSASLDESILILCMVLVGGVGNFRGPLVGAFVLLAIPELLRFAHFPDAVAANIRLLAYGGLLVVMAHFRPKGLAGEYRLE
jgi:branched-chain amino acid transport system permease protein